jgi:hypothetical protein
MFDTRRHSRQSKTADMLSRTWLRASACIVCMEPEAAHRGLWDGFSLLLLPSSRASVRLLRGLEDAWDEPSRHSLSAGGAAVHSKGQASNGRRHSCG